FRLAEFAAMMSDVEIAGVGLDDGCALQRLDEKYRILASQSNSFAHRLYRTERGVVREVLQRHDDFRPLGSLQDCTKPVGELAARRSLGLRVAGRQSQRGRALVAP